MTTNLEQLKKKIRRANPKSNWKELRGPAGMVLEMDRPIRLADVLLALEEAIKDKDYECRINTLGNFELIDLEITGGSKKFKVRLDDEIRWNLKSDSLDNQSPETINFLTELLCK